MKDDPTMVVDSQGSEERVPQAGGDEGQAKAVVEALRESVKPKNENSGAGKDYPRSKGGKSKSAPKGPASRKQGDFGQKGGGKTKGWWKETKGWWNNKWAPATEVRGGKGAGKGGKEGRTGKKGKGY